MPAVHLETTTLCCLEVVQLPSVDFLRDHLAVDLPADLELKDESLHGGHGVTDVDSCAVDVFSLFGFHVSSGVDLLGLGMDGGEGGSEGGFSEDGLGFAHHGFLFL